MTLLFYILDISAVLKKKLFWRKDKHQHQNNNMYDIHIIANIEITLSCSMFEMNFCAKIVQFFLN